MRRIALLGLLLVLTGCMPPLTDNMRRAATTPDVTVSAPPSPSTGPRMTAPAVGYGARPPAVPPGGLGAETPMPAPAPSRLPAIAPLPAAPPTPAARSGAAGQSISVPNGNGTTTIIHSDGTVETVPTPK